MDKLQYLIIDEADRMLDMGFIPQVKRIVMDRLGTIIMKIIMNIPKNYYENTKKLLWKYQKITMKIPKNYYENYYEIDNNFLVFL